ncbi:MAG TPA: DHHA1 domain-containing protein, partial [Pyrinomonadaceae bacterium]|nr:DHHA1 domain-containing protein [Pyrinomonadaceae bacterium]
DELIISRALGYLKTERGNLPDMIYRLQEELKRTRKDLEALKLKAASYTLNAESGSMKLTGSDVGLIHDDGTKEIAGIKVLARTIEGLDNSGVRQLSDTLLARLKSGIVILGRKDDGKVGIIVRVSDDLTDRIKAGNIIKEIAPIVGGRGGGKPDMAEGGGTEPDKLPEAIDASYKVIEGMLQ